MKQAKAKSLSAAVGRRLRELREAKGILQEQLAKRARDHGLPWSRGTVAAIELGQRRLSLEEFLWLPLVLHRAGIRAELLDLLPAAHGTAVTMTRASAMTSDAAREILQGRAGKVDIRELDTPEFRKLRKRLQERTTPEALERGRQQYQEAEKVWRRAGGGNLEEDILITAEEDASAEPERKAARNLGVSPVSVALAARKLWGLSLSEERERRLAEQGAQATNPRTLQAIRGHVTRELLSELQPLLEGIVAAKKRKLAAAAPAQKEGN